MLRTRVLSRHVSSLTIRKTIVSSNNFGRHGLNEYTTSGSTKTPRRLREPPPTIATLHPSRIQSSDFIDLSSHKMTRIYNSTTMLPSIITYFGGPNNRFLFPKICRGFFYYHRDPRLPDVSGAVRFRLTPDANVSSFRTGTDLMLPDRPIPWCIQLLAIANSRRYDGYEKLLLQDGLVSPSLLQHCQKLGMRFGRLCHHMLFALDQPFLFDVNSSPTLSVLARDGIETTQLVFTREFKALPQPRVCHPYAGQCMVRFERSLLPEHMGRRIIVLRVLEIVKPITLAVPGYEWSLLPPTAGSLLTKRGHPITVDVDRKNTPIHKILRLLLSPVL
ncbi:hypothetical protein Hypma_001433 [Hypsizygus marmoreus]|uniref:Uncharacterized protein n=1 Tax=Hypsizygus marmoreus TaxID=39966 RepID=A0A369K0Z9_HYPMA|nr:hypothetical protein Hypma_001433 [Hypsizygus marmoreus]